MIKISKAEKSFTNFINSKFTVIFLIAAFILSVLMRISAFSYVSNDMSGFLEGWYAQIEQLGRIKALNTQVGNYSVLYQTLIALMTYLPGSVIVKYKVLSCIFDYVLAFGVFFILYDKNKKDSLFTSLLASVIVIYSPIVTMNSAVWGQCDAMYTSFLILSLAFCKRENYTLTFIMFGLAFSLKLQAIFLLPFYLFEWINTRKFSIVYFLLSPLTMIFVCIPAYLNGRGFKGFISPYYYQTGSCDKMSFSYPSFWALFSTFEDHIGEFISAMKVPAIILTFIILFGIMAVVLKRQCSVLNTALVLTFTCVEFLPGMHERYAFSVEIMSIILAFRDKRTIPLAVSLNILTCLTYGQELFGGQVNLTLLAVFNLIIYALYLWILLKDTPADNVK